MTQRIARFVITGELLRQLLHLPGDTEFVDARRAGIVRGSGFDIEMTVRSETLPEVADGAAIPVVDPWYQTEYRDAEKHSVIKFQRWYC